MTNNLNFLTHAYSSHLHSYGYPQEVHLPNIWILWTFRIPVLVYRGLHNDWSLFIFVCSMHQWWFTVIAIHLTELHLLTALCFFTSLLLLRKGCCLLLERYIVLFFHRIHTEGTGNKQIISNQKYMMSSCQSKHFIVSDHSGGRSVYCIGCWKCEITKDRVNAYGCAHFTLLIKINLTVLCKYILL